MLASALLACAGEPAIAGAETTIFSQHPARHASKPARLGYTTAPFTVGVTVKLTGLRWRDWGERRATARGRGRICPNMAPCERRRITAVAKRRLRTHGADHFYSRLVVVLGDTRIRLCVSPEVCA